MSPTAAVVQVVEDGQPELGPLGLLPPDPQHLAVALDGDADRQVAGAVAHRAVLADLDHQAVEVRDRIDGVQRPCPPCGDVLKDGVGAPADGVALDLDVVELGEVILDVAHAHAAGIEPKDPVIQARQPGLALGHEPWIETAVAESGPGGWRTSTAPEARSFLTVFAPKRRCGRSGVGAPRPAG